MQRSFHEKIVNMFPDGGEISVISDPADSHMGGMEGEDLVPQVDNLSRMLASPYSVCRQGGLIRSIGVAHGPLVMLTCMINAKTEKEHIPLGCIN